MSSATHVFVVMGSIGEYSDRMEWPVRAFFNLEDARSLVVNASARAREISQWECPKCHGEWIFHNASWGTECVVARPESEHDPHHPDDQTGATYHLLQVPLEEA